MKAISIITTPSGDQMAVLPLADYERLLDAAEDLVEVTAYDTAMRLFASGKEEAVPTEFARRLIAGERPVRVWRDIRGLSGKALAEKAGLSAESLSQIETGEREGTLDLMRRLAEALGVTLDDLAG